MTNCPTLEHYICLELYICLDIAWMHYIGHVIGMPEHRLLKCVFYSELINEKDCKMAKEDLKTHSTLQLAI